MALVWEADTRRKFDCMIEKVPIFLREIARDKVSKKAENLAVNNGRSEIIEKDMIDAFFTETPFGFHGPMKNDMKACGIDYLSCGHPE